MKSIAKQLENREVLICPVCKENPVREGFKTCSGECTRKGYNQRPEIHAKWKAYYQRPEVKAYYQSYYQRPEVKAHKKAYNKKWRDKNRDKIKEYYQRPEVKAKRKAYCKVYDKAYSQRPEVKAKRKAHYQRKKKEISK